MASNVLRHIGQGSCTIAHDNKRLPSRLQAGQDAPQCLGGVWTPVEHVVADNFVESLSPVRVVSTSLGVPHAIGYIWTWIALAGFGYHSLGNVNT